MARRSGWQTRRSYSGEVATSGDFSAWTIAIHNREGTPVGPLPTPLNELERAIAIALDAHAGQRSRSGDPYVLHPLRVMLRLATDDERIAGVLHDVVERSPEWTLRRLAKDGFSPAIVDAVDALSRRDGEAYGAYIVRVSANELARRVKIADLEDKLESVRMDGRAKRFRTALSALRTRP